MADTEKTLGEVAYEAFCTAEAVCKGFHELHTELDAAERDGLCLGDGKWPRGDQPKERYLRSAWEVAAARAAAVAHDRWAVEQAARLHHEAAMLRSYAEEHLRGGLIGEAFLNDVKAAAYDAVADAVEANG